MKLDFDGRIYDGIDRVPYYYPLKIGFEIYGLFICWGFIIALRIWCCYETLWYGYFFCVFISFCDSAPLIIAFCDFTFSGLDFTGVPVSRILTDFFLNIILP